MEDEAAEGDGPADKASTGGDAAPLRLGTGKAGFAAVLAEATSSAKTHGALRYAKFSSLHITSQEAASGVLRDLL